MLVQNLAAVEAIELFGDVLSTVFVQQCFSSRMGNGKPRNVQDGAIHDKVTITLLIMRFHLQDKARQDKTRQEKARDTTRHEKTRQDKTWQ
jgi:hypothetical protein